MPKYTSLSIFLFKAVVMPVLRQMKRGHNSMLFKNFISKIRSMIPEMTIATDIICGFPTESEEDFLDTINLLYETKPDIVNLSKYASRPGTLASKMKKLDTGIVASKLYAP